MSQTTARIQNVYGDFLRSFKIFLDKITRNSLNKIEWNYGAKPLEYYYMMNGHETVEFPVAIIDIQDIQPVDGVSPIARNPRMHSLKNVHNIEICDNITKNQNIIMDRRWVNLVFTVTINTEDVTSMLNYHDLFIGQLPMNFMFYDYIFYNYIEVTDFVRNWDFENDTIENVFMRYDPTFRYDPDIHYKESNEDFFKTQERDRVAGGDAYPDLEGKRYFAMVKMEPILKFTSITKQTDKETQQHSIILNFEAQIELPNMLIWKQEFEVKSIELVIDTVDKANNPQEYPILIDMPDNFLTNKNISRGIMLSSDNFVFPRDENPPDPTKKPYLEVHEHVNLDVFSVALWAVENVTETSSSRFFVPLEHAIVEYIRENPLDDTSCIIKTRFTFKEMSWFEEFELGNPFNYLKLVFFKRPAEVNV